MADAKATEAAAEAAPVKNDQSKLILIVVIGVLSMVLVGGGVASFFLLREKGADTEQTAEAEEADAEAARIYAASFGKDPEFYDFYRAMQSYRTTFLGDGQSKQGQTSVILSPSNSYLKEFTGR